METTILAGQVQEELMRWTYAVGDGVLVGIGILVTALALLAIRSARRRVDAEAAAAIASHAARAA